VRVTSCCLTQKIAPNRPAPATTASIAVMLMSEAASVSSISTIAPTRSFPRTRKPVLVSSSSMPSLFATFLKSVASSGTRSIWARRPLGKPWKA